MQQKKIKFKLKLMIKNNKEGLIEEREKKKKKRENFVESNIKHQVWLRINFLIGNGGYRLTSC